MAGATSAVRVGGDIDIPVVESKLRNGLTVLLQPDPESEVFTLMLWVPAGVRTEPEGQTGISHFVEHCYSLGSAKLAPREIDRIVLELGGSKNAFTSYDYTSYYENLPRAALERIVELEADRLFELSFPSDAVRTELEVVKEERRLRTDNAATGLMNERLFELAYERHPYRNPIIGRPEDLDHFDAELARAYYRRHYHPSNCTFVLSGGFDVERALSTFERCFEHEVGSAPASEARVLEPSQAAERREVLRSDIASCSYVAQLYKAPAFDHEDSAALAVLSTVLLGGRAARLHRSLTRDAPVATGVSGGYWAMRDPGPFTLTVCVKDGVACEDAEAALDASLETVRQHGVCEDELERARTQRLLGKLSGLESTKGRGHALGAYQVTSEIGWRALGRSFERLNAVTREDVQRVARDYLCPTRRTVVWQHPKGELPKPGQISLPKTLPTKKPDDAKLPSARSSARRRPCRACSCGTSSYRLELDNGAVLLYQRSARLPIVAIDVSLRAGSAYDPPGRHGLATLTADLLRSGTRRHDEEAFALAFARLGTGLSISGGLEAVQLRTAVRSEDFSVALDLLAEAVLEPRFESEAMTRVRSEHISRGRVAWSRPSMLQNLGLIRALFGDHPYGWPVGGTPRGLSALSLDDVVDHYRRTYRPERMLISVTGDFEPKEVEARVQKILGSWRAEPASGVSSLVPLEGPSFVGAVMIPKGGQTQAHVELGQRIISRSHEDWDRMVLLNGVLGGAGLASRIPDRIRTREGLAYSVRSSLSSRQLTGVLAISAQTKCASASRVVELIREETSRLLDEGIGAEELDRVKARLEGTLPFRTETMASHAAALITQERYGLEPDYLRRQIDHIKSVEPDELLEVARRHLDPEALTLVVVSAPGPDLDVCAGGRASMRWSTADFDRS